MARFDKVKDKVKDKEVDKEVDKVKDKEVDKVKEYSHDKIKEIIDAASDVDIMLESVERAKKKAEESNKFLAEQEMLLKDSKIKLSEVLSSENTTNKVKIKPGVFYNEKLGYPEKYTDNLSSKICINCGVRFGSHFGLLCSIDE